MVESPHTRSSAKRRIAFVSLVPLLLGLLAVVGLLYSRANDKAFLRERREAQSPEFTEKAPATFRSPGGTASASTSMEPQVEGMHPGARAIDMAWPIRVTWPLDIGPDASGSNQGEARICLRARQGVNELQNPGEGKAYYPFTVETPGEYRSWCRVRWVNDGVGHIKCNNSWFAGFDALPAAVVGNETDDRDWFWEKGPTAHLEAGVHWFRVELREDGTRMDRAVIAAAAAELTPERLETVALDRPLGLAGVRIPHTPDTPVQPVEIMALTTGSLAVGAGHRNQVTFLASYHASDGATFSGRIEADCPSAPGLVIEGDPVLACSRANPRTRRVLTLRFPADALRRAHRVTFTVRDTDTQESISRTELRFVKPYAWAFLGPFADTVRASKRVYRYTGTIDRLRQACDGTPMRLAKRLPVAKLGLGDVPVVRGIPLTEWRIVDDGSCTDWTGAVDAAKVFGTAAPAFAYAVTWIHAETALNHRSFTFQADDSGWLWANGHTVAQLPLDLPREAHRIWTSAPLRKGPNPVVIKLTQNQRFWGFRFDVVDWHWQGRRGDVITGLDIAEWPK